MSDPKQETKRKHMRYDKVLQYYDIMASGRIIELQNIQYFDIVESLIDFLENVFASSWNTGHNMILSAVYKIQIGENLFRFGYKADVCVHLINNVRENTGADIHIHGPCKKI